MGCQPAGAGSDSSPRMSGFVRRKEQQGEAVRSLSLFIVSPSADRRASMARNSAPGAQPELGPEGHRVVRSQLDRNSSTAFLLMR
jgi:hypothetical protein